MFTLLISIISNRTSYLYLVAPILDILLRLFHFFSVTNMKLLVPLSFPCTCEQNQQSTGQLVEYSGVVSKELPLGSMTRTDVKTDSASWLRVDSSG
jgi:hypothetical protein